MAKEKDEKAILNFKQRFLQVQNILSVPKTEHNDFGNYNYRSAEGIMGAAKPLCVAQQLMLVVKDDIEKIGERYYVKATATIKDCLSDDFEVATGYARESESKRGMDDSQVTGATSSYARKIALNGLFCLNDVKDTDTNEFHDETEKLKQQADDLELELKGYRHNLQNAATLLQIPSEGMSKIIKAVTGRDNSKQLSINELNDITLNLEKYAEEYLGGNK
jgi:hypothetical protein